MKTCRLHLGRILANIAVVLGICSGVRSEAAVLADSVAEFSGVQGQRNWYYGYYPSPFTPSAFVQMPSYDGAGLNGGSWTMGQPWTRIWNSGCHPGKDSVVPETWAVRRWISPIAGNLLISGVIADFNAGGGDGVVAYIFVNGTQVFRKNINNGETTDFSYTVPISVTIGSRVDFVIAPKSNQGWDGTRFTAQIVDSEIPPSSGPQVFWAGDQATCDGVFSPGQAAFHAGGYWLNFLRPGAGDEAVFPMEAGPPAGNIGYNPRTILFGDVTRRAAGLCLFDSFTAGGPATLRALFIKRGSWNFYFRSESGPPDTARLTVLNLTRVGTPSSWAQLRLHAGTMISGPVVISGPLDFNQRPTSELRISNDAILQASSVTVGRGGKLVGAGRVRGAVNVSGGKVEPGSSPGTLTIEGDLYLSPESELELEVGGLAAGMSYDQVVVEGGESVISGTVRVSFVDGFAPQAGDRFTFFGPGALDASTATIVTDPGVTIAGAGTQSLEVVSIPTPPAEYQQWRQAKFASSTSREGEPTANLDGDEVQNFTEFLFNLEPNAADEHILEPGVGASGLPIALIVESAGAKRAAFEFIRHKRFGPYVVESSADLETWTPETPEVDSVVSVSDDYERVRVLDISLPQEGSSNRRFLRISVAR